MDYTWLEAFDQEEKESFLKELLVLIDRQDFGTYNNKCAALSNEVQQWKESARVLADMELQERFIRQNGAG